MSLHKQIADALTEKLPSSWIIRPGLATHPDNLAAGQIYLGLWTDHKSAGGLEWQNTLTFRLMHGGTGPAADDALDDALTLLFDALYDLGASGYSELRAQAGIFPNAAQIPTFLGWEITATIPTPNYR